MLAIPIELGLSALIGLNTIDSPIHVQIPFLIIELFLPIIRRYLLKHDYSVIFSAVVCNTAGIASLYWMNQAYELNRSYVTCNIVHAIAASIIIIGIYTKETDSHPRTKYSKTRLWIAVSSLLCDLITIIASVILDRIGGIPFIITALFVWADMVEFIKWRKKVDASISISRALFIVNNARRPKNWTDDIEFNQTQCSICIDDDHITNGGLSELKKCKHVFHKECLQQWLSRHPKCPSCQDTLV
jgi:hypothetical protein